MQTDRQADGTANLERETHRDRRTEIDIDRYRYRYRQMDGLIDVYGQTNSSDRQTNMQNDRQLDIVR